MIDDAGDTVKDTAEDVGKAALISLRIILLRVT